VDFQTAPDVGILYLSLKYYNYRPKYIEQRVAEIPVKNFRVLILLVLVDQTNGDIACRNLSVLCTKLKLSLVLAFNLGEAAKYVETLKIYAKKGPEALKPKFEESERTHKMFAVTKSVNNTGTKI
jgi:DNA excision repair protein ERCC-1